MINFDKNLLKLTNLKKYLFSNKKAVFPFNFWINYKKRIPIRPITPNNAIKQDIQQQEQKKQKRIKSMQQNSQQIQDTNEEMINVTGDNETSNYIYDDDIKQTGYFNSQFKNIDNNLHQGQAKEKGNYNIPKLYFSSYSFNQNHNPKNISESNFLAIDNNLNDKFTNLKGSSNQSSININGDIILEQSNRNSNGDSLENSHNQDNLNKKVIKQVEKIDKEVMFVQQKKQPQKQLATGVTSQYKQQQNKLSTNKQIPLQQSIQNSTSQLSSLQLQLIQQNNKKIAKDIISKVVGVPVLDTPVSSKKQLISQEHIIQNNNNSLVNNISGNTTQQFNNSQPNSLVNTPNKYFYNNSSANQYSEMIPQVDIAKVSGRVESQLVQQNQNGGSEQKIQSVRSSVKNMANLQNYQNQLPPSSPQNSRTQIQQQQQPPPPPPKRENINLFRQNQSHPNSPKMSSQVSSPQNISQRPSFYTSKNFSSTDNLFTLSRSNSPPLPQGINQRKSINNQFVKRPSVYFRYFNNIQPTTPTSISTHTQNQIITQHHHITQKIVTVVVWQNRYWTVIQKFNYMNQKFNNIANEVKIISQLMQKIKNKQKYQQLYSQLINKHTTLLSILSQIQYNMNNYMQQSKQFKKQTNYQNQYQQYMMYVNKCKILQEDNRKLIGQIDRFNHQLQSAFTQINKLNQIRKKQFNQNHTLEMEMKVKKIQEELLKSLSIKNQLMNYVSRLELDNRNLQQQVEKTKGTGEKKSPKLEQLKKASQQNSSTVNLSQQQYITQINQLQSKIQQYEQNKKNSQYSEQKYSQIIQIQKNIIQNIQKHFKQFTQSSNIKQIQLKNILSKQQNIIKKLQHQLHQNNMIDHQHISKQKQKMLVDQIQKYQHVIKQLKCQIDQANFNYNKIKQQLIVKNSQINLLHQQQKSFHLMYQTKLQQKLIAIEQELKAKDKDNANKSMQKMQISTHSIQHNSKHIDELNQQIERLCSQLKKKQQQKLKIQQQFITQQQHLKIKLLQQQSKIRQLNDRILTLQEQNKKKHGDKDKKIRQLLEQMQTLNEKLKSQTLTSKSGSQLALSHVYAPYSPTKNDQQLKSIRDKLFQKQCQNSDIAHQKQNMQKKYQSLLTNFNNIDTQNAKKDQQLMSLKRQISSMNNYQSQINSLMDAIKKKNQSILQLKTLSFQRNQFKVQLDALKNQKNGIKGTIQSKNNQIQNLRQSINQLQSKLRQTKLKQSLYPNTNQSVADELQLMYQSVKKKQSQINKLKQTNQLLETNVQQLQYQLQRTKNKLGTIQKNLALQKQQYTNQINGYEGRVKQFEIKIKNMDEIQKQGKIGYEQEIQGLQNLIKQKQDQIRKLESENKVLKNKLKNYDIKIEQVDFEREALNNKIKQLQTMRQDLKKKIQKLQYSQQNNKNKLNDQYQIKIVQLEKIIKVKDNKIKLLQNNIETFKIKQKHNNQNQDDIINQQQIQVLRRKITQYQSRYNKKYIQKYYKIKDYQNTSIFEQKIIYDLKNENQKLKSLLSNKGIKYPQNSPPTKSAPTQFIQKRLLDFNQRLQQMIQQNKNLEQNNIYFTFNTQHKYNQDLLLSSFEKQRKSIFKKHRSQISALQSRMMELQRYCSSLENNTYNGNGFSNTKLVFHDTAKGVYSEQLAYYKQKNIQLKDLIDNHIKLNKQLKQKLQGLAKGNGDDGNSLQFYRLQVQQYKKQNCEHLQRIKLLTEQNNSLNKNINELRNNREDEDKLVDLQNKIHELNRKNTSLQMQNGILQSDISRYDKELKNANEEILKTKISNQKRQQRILVLQNNIIQSNSKLSVYEKQNVKYSNQIKLQQSQIQRLTGINSQKQGLQNSQLTRYKNKITQLQNKLRKYQQDQNGWNEQKVLYQQNLSIMNNKINSLQIQVSRVNFVNDSINKKIRDAENYIYELQSKIKTERGRADEFENSLKSKQSQLNNLHYQLQQKYQIPQQSKKQKQVQDIKTKQKLTYIKQLQDNILNLQNQIVQNNIQIQKLRCKSQNYQLKFDQINGLEEKCQYLEIQVEKYSKQISVIKSENNVLRQQRVDKEGAAYRLEYIRSFFTEIDVLVRQVMINSLNTRQVSIGEKIRWSIDKGLKICSESFDLL